MRTLEAHRPSSSRLPAAVIAQLVRLEPVSAPVCAGLLLLHPTPLTWPALVLGLLPSAARLVAYRRPWWRTPFDLPLGLLVAGGLVGSGVALDPLTASVRLAGLASAVILFAWLRQHATSPTAAYRTALACLAGLAVAALLLVHIAQPFLLLGRVPPLQLLAGLLEPLGLYRLLVADEAALQRFRWYASGAGALAAAGLSLAAGLALAEVQHWRRVGFALLGLCFLSVLIVADNRGSMVAAALTLGALVVWWRPKLFLVAVLLVFGTLDLIALGMVQRGLNLRTVLERLAFWQNGLVLAAETPLTGVGLGVRSVELTYRAAFQPTYPPFSHTHSIYVQGLLEQGALGLAGLVLLLVLVLRCASGVRQLPDARLRGAGFAAGAGSLALLASGLTEIAALTSVGGALLAALLGLLAAVTTSEPGSQPVQGERASGLTAWLQPPGWPRLTAIPARRRRTVAVVAGVGLLAVVVVAAGLARPLAALPFLNAGTSALYRGTLRQGLSRSERAEALSTASSALQTAASIDPAGVAARRNLALVAAAQGNPLAARQHADDARALANQADRRAMFGIGRAYAQIEAWEPAIAALEQAGAGPQLLRVGRQLAQNRQHGDLAHGLRALSAAARLGAPGRLAQDAIVQAVLNHGETLEQALGHLDPLLDDGPVGYQTRLEFVRIYRRAGRLDEAEVALAQAERIGRDQQLELERGLLLHLRGQNADAEPILARAAVNLRDPALPLPDGDDPRYWLAAVQARLARYDDAVRTARAGLANLPSEQASLRVPYHLLLGENLLALGRPGEALTVYQAGLRIAPTDARLADGVSRAREAARRP